MAERSPYVRCRDCKREVVWLKTRKGSNILCERVSKDGYDVGADEVFDREVHDCHWQTYEHDKDIRSGGTPVFCREDYEGDPPPVEPQVAEAKQAMRELADLVNAASDAAEELEIPMDLAMRIGRLLKAK